MSLNNRELELLEEFLENKPGSRISIQRLNGEVWKVSTVKNDKHILDTYAEYLSVAISKAMQKESERDDN